MEKKCIIGEAVKGPIVNGEKEKYHEKGYYTDSFYSCTVHRGGAVFFGKESF